MQTGCADEIDARQTEHYIGGIGRHLHLHFTVSVSPSRLLAATSKRCSPLSFMKRHHDLDVPRLSMPSRDCERVSCGLRILEKDVLLPVKAYHVQPVKQVRQKLAALHKGIERLCRGGEDLRSFARVEPSQ
jgi:hypothetical protein